MGFFYKVVPGDTYCITEYQGSDKHVEIPTNINVSILSDFLFKGHTEIESVKIPDTVTQMGGFLFDGCTNLKELALPSSLQDLWQYSLTRTSIEEIEIPGSVKQIIPFTFFQSKSLKKVVFNEGTASIGANAFKDCTALTEVYLPSTLTSIHEDAFDGCGDVKFIKNED